ncbi:hypothetical protein [Clostridium botulinum]|nr:hypothetical protein [Clostridium botulinum]
MQSKFQEPYEQNIKSIYTLANKHRIFARKEIIIYESINYG